MLQNTLVKHVHEPFVNGREPFANAREWSAKFYLQSAIAVFCNIVKT